LNASTLSATATAGDQHADYAIRRLYPDYPLWRDFAYEYQQGKLAIDVINGGPLLRDWVDDARLLTQIQWICRTCLPNGDA
jgi:hypothetical protein